jgi:hypothetical protein
VRSSCNSGACFEAIFDVHGLELESQEVAHLIMQRVLHHNPEAKVQVEKESEPIVGFKDLPPMNPDL